MGYVIALLLAAGLIVAAYKILTRKDANAPASKGGAGGSSRGDKLPPAKY